MKAELYIENIIIGVFELNIIDESMGIAGGQFFANTNYQNFQSDIQKQCDENGISNSENFNFIAKKLTGEELIAEGGIGITDIKAFDEIEIEICGLNNETIEEIKNCP
jgi:hypothetical protein